MNTENKWVVELESETGGAYLSRREWKPIRPTGGNRYELATIIEAITMLNMCYPDTPREWLRVRQLEDGE